MTTLGRAVVCLNYHTASLSNGTSTSIFICTSVDQNETEFDHSPTHLGYNLLRRNNGTNEGCSWLCTALRDGTGAVDNHVLFNASGEILIPTGLDRRDIRAEQELHHLDSVTLEAHPPEAAGNHHKLGIITQKHTSGNRSIKSWWITKELRKENS